MGQRTGGRQKGTPNKQTVELEALCEKLDVSPFHVMLLFAKGDAATLGYEFIPPEQRLKAATEASKYLYPQRKAVEHTGNLEHAGEIKLTIRDYTSGPSST